MAVTVGASISGGSTSGGVAVKATSFSPGAITTVGGAGSVLVAMAAHGSYLEESVLPAALSDSKGNTWRLLDHARSATGGACSAWICERPVGGAGHTVTLTVGTATYLSLTVAEFTGCAQAGPILMRYAPWAQQATSPVTTPLVTFDAGAGALVRMAVSETAATETWTDSSGFTTIQQSTNGTLIQAVWLAAKTVTAGTAPITYSKGTSANCFTLVLALAEQPAAPIITAQPVSQTVAPGAAATMIVTASASSGALAYQWQASADGQAWSNVSGATSASFTTPSLQPADHGGWWRAIVTDAAGSATSAPARTWLTGAPSAGRGMRLRGWADTHRAWFAGTGGRMLRAETRFDDRDPAERRIWGGWFGLGQPVAAELAADLAAEAEVSAALATSIRLASSMSAQAAAQADLVAQVLLQAGLASDAAAQGALLTSIQLQAGRTRKNLIRRADFSGATVGVLGAGGAVPAGMQWNTGTGLTREVLGTGATAEGLPYIDLRISGTNSGGGMAYPDLYLLTTGAERAWPGEKYTASASIFTIAGSRSGFNDAAHNINVCENSAVGAYLTSSGVSTSGTARAAVTRTMAHAQVWNVSTFISLAVPAGNSVDLTFRVVAPQLEPGDQATAFIPTSGAPVAIFEPVAAEASMAADLATSIMLAATAAGEASVTAALSTEVRLSAALAAEAVSAADLFVLSGFAAQLGATASISASLVTAIRLAASPSATATMTAPLVTQIRLSAMLEAEPDLAAALKDFQHALLVWESGDRREVFSAAQRLAAWKPVAREMDAETMAQLLKVQALARALVKESPARPGSWESDGRENQLKPGQDEVEEEV